MEINKKSILRSSEIMNKRELCQRLSIGKAQSWFVLVESPQAVVATSQSFTDEDIGVLKTRHRIQNNELFSYFSFWLLEMFSQFQEKLCNRFSNVFYKTKLRKMLATIKGVFVFVVANWSSQHHLIPLSSVTINDNKDSQI